MNKEDLINFLQSDLVKLKKKLNKISYSDVVPCDMEAACDSGYSDEMNQVAKEMHIDYNDLFSKGYPTDGLSESTDEKFIQKLIKLIRKH